MLRTVLRSCPKALPMRALSSGSRGSFQGYSDADSTRDHVQPAEALRFFRLEEEAVSSTLSEGLPPGLQDMWDVVDESALLIRPPAQQLIQRLVDFQDRSKKGRYHYLIDGPRGSGKSTTLLHVVHHARSEGWLTLYVPRGRELTFYPEDIFPSSQAGLYDQPLASQAVLSALKESHADKLEQLPQRNSYDVGRYTSSSGSSSQPNLLDMVQYGLNYERESTETFTDLFAELQQVTEFPVLIAVDAVNFLYEPSGYWHDKKRRVRPEELLLARCFRPFDERMRLDKPQLLRNGIYIGATSYRFPELPPLDKAVHKRARSVVEVPALTDEEAGVLVDYLKAKHVVSPEVRTADLLRYLKDLSPAGPTAESLVSQALMF